MQSGGGGGRPHGDKWGSSDWKVWGNFPIYQ
jgi:hypothetical protein